MAFNTSRSFRYAAWAVLGLSVAFQISAFQNCGRFQSNPSSNANGAAFGVIPEGIPDATGEPAAALAGTPLVHQIRNGSEIATFPNLSAVFQRVGGYRVYQTGDIFELDPAIYLGANNQAWIGPKPLNATEGNMPTSQWLMPTNITIRGRTVNGYRPVVRLDSSGASNNTLGQSIIYLDQSQNVTIDNIDFDGADIAGVGKSGVYLNGVNGFTLRHSRVMHFKEANGVFSTGNNVGIVLFENVEAAFNGGDSGPEHNFYMGESNSDSYYDASYGHRSDPAHTMIWRGVYSHDAYYGHTLKSRAQNNIVEGCYLKGKEVAANQAQGEAYLADFPNGGNVLVRNSVLEKGDSGDNSNGLFVTYAMEGQQYPNASSIVITHNSFIARSKTYDSQGHLLQPLSLFYPNQLPTDSSFPIANVQIAGNFFVGFETNPSLVGAAGLYRGSDFLELSDLSAINADFSLQAPQNAMLSSIGQLGAAIPLGTVSRTKSTFGAID